jgi:hypothetical protein
MWEPRRLTTLWASTACYKGSFSFTFTNFIIDGCFKLNTNCILTDRYSSPLTQFVHRTVNANTGADSLVSVYNVNKYNCCKLIFRNNSRNSVRIAQSVWRRAAGWTAGVRNGQGVFLFSAVPALGPIQLPVKWVPEFFPRG